MRSSDRGLLLQAALGAFVVIGVTAAGVAGGLYFWIHRQIVPPGPAPPGNGAQTDPLEPGGPRTLLILGSDRRAARSADGAQRPRSDTILLVRLDPKRNRVATLSIPRDLAVSIPGHGDGLKINQAYDMGRAALTARTVRHLFAASGPFPINSVIDVDFNGFQRVVNYLHGVYVDVDRDYYVAQDSGTSAIDIKAGYQRLAGSDALAYVRYRHTDSDLYRAVRQQDFLRQAARQPAVREVANPGDASRLLRILTRYMSVDKSFYSARNLFGMLKTGAYLAAGHAPVDQIAFAGVTDSKTPRTDTRLFISQAALRRIRDRFMNGDEPRAPVKRTATRKRSAGGGLESARAAGERLAVLADAKLGFPFAFPSVRASGSSYPSGTPRIYDLQGHEAYRLVIATGRIGEYYGVEGTTWAAPPILAHPDGAIVRNGRRLLLFYDGPRLRVVGWRTRHAVYWVSNTVTRSLANAKLIAIAASLTRLKQ